MVANMRKTFYYSFMPSKAEEDAVADRNMPYQVTRTLVEIRDWYPTLRSLDPNNPWQIRKTITSNEVVSAKLTLSQEEMFEHVFRFWTLDMTNHLILGNKCFVVLIDYTDDMPKKIESENIFVKKGPNDTYVLGFGDVVCGRFLNPGDEVGLFWDLRSGTLGFKLLRRGNSIN